jgi:hypothetical protein
MLPVLPVIIDGNFERKTEAAAMCKPPEYAMAKFDHPKSHPNHGFTKLPGIIIILARKQIRANKP